MAFSVKTTITACPSLQGFFEQWNVGGGDLIITNEYLLSPRMAGRELPCDVLYQERYGKGEPNDEMVDAMLAAIDGKAYARIIAIGGGTVIDIAKLFVFGESRCETVFAGGAKLPRKRSLVIIPTTCGTGSEVTSISIIEFKAKKTKLGLAVPALFADEAVLIDELLDSMPYEVFAASSIDALIHAIESYVSPKADVFTRAMGESAIRTIIRGYQQFVANGPKGALPENIREFLPASTMAGIAFGNAGCAAVHALSYPIGGIYHVPHGKANYLMFEEVFAAYRRLGADLSALEQVLLESLGCAADAVWPELFKLIDQVLSRDPLRTLGVGKAECASMAESVIKQQQRLMGNSPVPLTQKDVEEIYTRCM